MKSDILPNIDKIVEESFAQEEFFKQIIQNNYNQYFNIKNHLEGINFERIHFYEISCSN